MRLGIAQTAFGSALGLLVNYHLSEFTSVFCQVVQCCCPCIEYRALSIGALTIAQLLSNFSKVGIHRAFIFEHLGRFVFRPS